MPVAAPSTPAPMKPQNAALLKATRSRISPSVSWHAEGCEQTPAPIVLTSSPFFACAALALPFATAVNTTPSRSAAPVVTLPAITTVLFGPRGTTGGGGG